MITMKRAPKKMPGTMRMLVEIAAIASVSLAAQLSHALEITEIEPNDRIDIAQNIDPFFSTGFVQNIESGPASNNSASVPHVTINSLPGDDTFDIFSFTVAMAGSTGIFDTDNAEISGMDSYLRLFDTDANGNGVLAANDDAPFDGPGDQIGNTFNSFFRYTFTNPGVYYIEVGETPLTPNGPPTEVLPGSSYQLHVSLAAPVPEPGTLALFGLGILGVGLSRRRQA